MSPVPVQMWVGASQVLVPMRAGVSPVKRRRARELQLVQMRPKVGKPAHARNAVGSDRTFFCMANQPLLRRTVSATCRARAGYSRGTLGVL